MHVEDVVALDRRLHVLARNVPYTVSQNAVVEGRFGRQNKSTGRKRKL